MSKKWIVRLFSFFFLFSAGGSALAQDGTYSGYTPYSVYGIGDLHNGETAFNAGMGGTGIATRNKRFLTYANPASITCRDSLSFMADFGMSGRSSFFAQGNLRDVNNIFNLSNLAISFPVYRSSAMMIGIAPYSDVGYKFSHVETDPVKVGLAGNHGYTVAGSGGTYQLFIGGAATFWKRVSVGAEFLYYFGKIDRNVLLQFEQDSYRTTSTGYGLNINAISGKFGLQYEQPLGHGSSIVLGATYKMRNKIGGNSVDFRYAYLSGLTDTLRNDVYSLRRYGKLKMPGEIGVGVSYRKDDKLAVEFNYRRSNWASSGFDSTDLEARGFSNIGTEVFSSGVSQSFRAGFEFTPNRTDVRYRFKTFTYRAGAYYETAYYRLNGNTVNSYGITLGATIPVFRGYNGITFALDMGQKGRLDNNMIRERYIGLNLSFNIFDLWFIKFRYN